MTHLDAVNGVTPGFDTRMNDYRYSFTILDGPAAGTVLDVDRVVGTKVYFKTGWPDGKMPVIGDNYFYAPVNPNVLVSETEQVDVVNVYNGNSPSDDTAVLTEDRLYGLGMGPDTVIGGVAIPGASLMPAWRHSTSNWVPEATP